MIIGCGYRIHSTTPGGYTTVNFTRAQLEFRAIVLTSSFIFSSFFLITCIYVKPPHRHKLIGPLEGVLIRITRFFP